MARDDGPAPLEATDLVAPSSAVPVQVAEIVDGDTLHVVAVDGTELTVRLFGVDTPERGEACYAEATARLAALAGSEVLLLPDVRLEDRGGRALRYVFTAEGASIDAALVDEGLAVAWRDDGAYRDQIVALEDTARSAGTGCLWGG
ncbi:MAG: thermonuclease family protein [Chloroflexi bacterium]|nr:thermonuclease family protein [Chloroflexota bacterium]MDA1146639.1 thermonuclease family protein [Chloroflexota bacterium]MQC82819.1 thermonuclease family protein [Chloroflexota bacterium]